MTITEARFKAVVIDLHNKGIYPGPTAISKALGRTGRLNVINGRETKWRHEIFKELGIQLQRPINGDSNSN